jgi:hypothetical protein
MPTVLLRDLDDLKMAYNNKKKFRVPKIASVVSNLKSKHVKARARAHAHTHTHTHTHTYIGTEDRI